MPHDIVKMAKVELRSCFKTWIAREKPTAAPWAFPAKHGVLEQPLNESRLAVGLRLQAENWGAGDKTPDAVLGRGVLSPSPALREKLECGK